MEDFAAFNAENVYCNLKQFLGPDLLERLKTYCDYLFNEFLEFELYIGTRNVFFFT